MTVQQKITPCLWFDGNAEEAIEFYTSIFENSRLIDVAYYGDAGPGPKGRVMMAKFQLEGQEFLALNGGPEFHFTEAISLSVACETQQEIDEVWARLTAGGGAPGPCGWLKDRFGLSWQIVPAIVGRMLSDPDPAKSNRAMEAVLRMGKLDIETIRQAYEGESASRR